MQSNIIKSRFEQLFGSPAKASRTMKCMYEIMTGDNLDSPASQWLSDSGEIITMSFGALNENVKSIASFLSKRLDGQHGNFVGLSMDNSHLWQVCFWALLMSGFKPVLIDINHREEMVDYIVESAGAKAILGRNPIEIKNKVEFVTIDELKAINNKAEFTPNWADNLALCTSGTTATAKILVFDGKAISYQLEGFYKVYLRDRRIAYAPTPVKSLAFLPMHHVLGFITLCIAYPFLNTTIVFMKDRSPASIQAACQKIGVTHMVSVPLLINNLKN